MEKSNFALLLLRYFMNLRLILSLIMCSFAVPMFAMEAPESLRTDGFASYGTYWCQDTQITIGKGSIKNQQFQNGPSEIVCFADSYLKKIPTTMSDDIYSAAGSRLLDELQSLLGEKYCPILEQNVRCPVGEAVCTSAGNLHVTNIIHTVVPNCVSPKQNRRRKELLKNAYTNCLETAQKNNILQIAFPSTGDIYKEAVQPIKVFPREEAAMVAVKTIVQFVRDNPRSFKEIRLVFPTISRDGNDDYAAYLKVLEQISEKQTHTASAKFNIDPDKLDKLDTPLSTLVKRYWLRNWAKYKHEIILGSCGAVTALCAGWLWWHRK